MNKIVYIVLMSISSLCGMAEDLKVFINNETVISLNKSDEALKELANNLAQRYRNLTMFSKATYTFSVRHDGNERWAFHSMETLKNVKRLYLNSGNAVEKMVDNLQDLFFNDIKSVVNNPEYNELKIEIA